MEGKVLKEWIIIYNMCAIYTSVAFIDHFILDLAPDEYLILLTNPWAGSAKDTSHFQPVMRRVCLAWKYFNIEMVSHLFYYFSHNLLKDYV